MLWFKSQLPITAKPLVGTSSSGNTFEDTSSQSSTEFCASTYLLRQVPLTDDASGVFVLHWIVASEKLLGVP